MSLSYEPVSEQDFESVFALRMEALEVSLKRLGRWNPEVSRKRFVAAFSPKYMSHIVNDGQRIGFYTFHPEGQDWRLQHLYFDAQHRAKGFGSAVMQRLQQFAQDQSKSIVLEALKQSDANRFNKRHAFIEMKQDEFDVYYCWQPMLLKVEP